MCQFCQMLGYNAHGGEASLAFSSSDAAGAPQSGAAISGATTGNIFIDTLAGISWLDVGGDRNITYYFDETSPTHLWTPFEMARWQDALQQWANVANITTQRVSSAAAADINETWVTPSFMQIAHGLPTFAGHHYLPSGSPPSTGEFNVLYLFGLYNQSGLGAGGLGLELFEHELGHALGLVHPHGSIYLPGPRPLFPGVTGEGDLGTLGYNQRLYSIMSYNQGPKTNSGSNDYGHAATPMAFDIAAIQSLYGPNTGYRAGADTYVLPDVNAAGTFWQCIWDAGGTDTIRYDGKLNATIDLHAATLVNGDPNAGGAVSQVAGTFGGFTIAKGVVIENAFGGSGNDTLTGNSADNVLSGNAGDDTAVYSGNRSSYTLQNAGDRILVSGPDGNDTLFSIEHVRFADTTINFNAPTGSFNPLFDAQFYYLTYPDVANAGADAKQHYDTSGWHEGRDPDALFSTRFYLASNFDVRKSGVNPLDQYYQTGWKEGRDPSPNFDIKLYLLHNPDVAAAGIDPLEHYLHHGKAEGRAIYAAIGSLVGGFDAEYYVIHNPDVAAAGIDPLAHFNSSGWREGRNPNALFDTAGYLAAYPDIAAAGINPLTHYETSGWREGRDPSKAFDTLGYLGAYPDVAAAHVNPLDHYLMNGIYEGRSIVSDGAWHY